MNTSFRTDDASPLILCKLEYFLACCDLVNVNKSVKEKIIQKFNLSPLRI